MRTLAAVMMLIAFLATSTVLGQGLSAPPTKVCQIGDYTCPMHPEIQATWPARCPLCQTMLTDASSGAAYTGVTPIAARGGATGPAAGRGATTGPAAGRGSGMGSMAGRGGAMGTRPGMGMQPGAGMHPNQRPGMGGREEESRERMRRFGYGNQYPNMGYYNPYYGGYGGNFYYPYGGYSYPYGGYGGYSFRPYGGYGYMNPYGGYYMPYGGFYYPNYGYFYYGTPWSYFPNYWW